MDFVSNVKRYGGGSLPLELFDRDLLAAGLKDKMREEGLAIRATAKEIGCSTSTLARMLQGSKSENFPQGNNLIKAASWLGESLAEFEGGRNSEVSPLVQVEAHLRAVPNLEAEAIDAVMSLVKALSDEKRQQ